MVIPAEIRIYFECFEQANHYVLPIVKEKTRHIFKKNIPIRLVKLRKYNSYDKYFSRYSRKIANLLFWKDPDILVSFIYEDLEIPIFVVEFSTAVFTEDHELQRFDGLVASAENNVVFIKVSPISKTSDYDHGGNIEFDYRIPFALIFRRYGILPFHIEWKSSGSIVEVNENYLSCPKTTDDFKEAVGIIFKSIGKSEINKEKLTELAKNSKRFCHWVEQLESIDINTLFKDRLDRTTRISIVDDHAEIKINRFGHAMDPERGMLVFYSIYFDGNIICKMVFDDDPKRDAWYKKIPREKEIQEYISKKGGLREPLDFLYVFYLGVNLENLITFEDFRDYIVTQKRDCIILDVSEFIQKYWYRLNKPLRTIFRYSKEFHIEDKNGVDRVILKWRENVFDNIDSNIKNIKQDIKVTPICRFSEIDEDLVTYIVIHNILRPQGYKILAASYPGAQGDRVILVERATKGGRRQERKYIDIISFSKSRNITTLQENKGKFSASQINNSIDNLLKYKKDASYKRGLELFFKKFEKDAVSSTIKIGVGFWSHKEYSAKILKKIKLDELDYFVLITRDMKKWKVWRCGDADILDIYEGTINLPIIFEPAKDVTLSHFMEFHQHTI